MEGGLYVPAGEGDGLWWSGERAGDGDLAIGRDADIVVAPESGGDQLTMEVLSCQADKEGHDI